MNSLKRNNISLNWLLAYVGITNSWLSINDAIADILADQFNSIDEDIIADLYLASEESRESFLHLLQQFGGFSTELLKKGIWIWSVAFLNDIKMNNKSISEKLNDIANIWSLVGYPENWQPFIYYMPIAENEESGEDKIYNKFVKFLGEENSKLYQLGIRRGNVSY